MKKTGFFRIHRFRKEENSLSLPPAIFVERSVYDFSLISVSSKLTLTLWTKLTHKGNPFFNGRSGLTVGPYMVDKWTGLV